MNEEQQGIWNSIQGGAFYSFYVLDDYGGLELWYVRANEASLEDEEGEDADLLREIIELGPYSKLIGYGEMLGVLKNPHFEENEENIGSDPAHWIPIRECLRVDPHYQWVTVK